MIALFNCKSSDQSESTDADDGRSYTEAHRPQLHFSPKEKWMNDPNGLVHLNGEYHLFYQYHPDGMTWGPMHWGHAISNDLIHWQHLPIALYPDSLGLIFSGSAVVDKDNTSGLGTQDDPPLVAIFTYHSMEKEKDGDTDYQNQGIAFSTDKGRTWDKYSGNPVLKNQGIKDFRDPKVFWHQESSKWVMILAVKDHVELWGSQDLKQWSKLSDFGYAFGAHGGVWECPDLFHAPIEGEQQGKWVMIVSINPGGPNGGSATQYFVGNFDGKTFTSDTGENTTLWLDYGPDNYAGVTFSNAPDNRRIFLGWMSNWAYAQEVPTSPWRSAMTLPRDLSLARIGDRLLVRSTLSPETSRLTTSSESLGDISTTASTSLGEEINFSQAMISGTTDAEEFTVEVFNDLGQKVAIGFEPDRNQFFINRGESGKNAFSKNFNSMVTAPRLATTSDITFTIVFDVSSVEVFFDGGLTVMTSLYFPDQPLSKMRINGSDKTIVKNLQVKKLGSIWH